MKCSSCGYDNKETAKVCKKCARDLTIAPAWFPDAHWHMKTLGIIYAGLAVLYVGVTLALKQLPRPYHLREIPIEMTPWLRSGPKHLPQDQLKPPPAPAKP